jgi:hypothetical protein
LSIKQGVNIRKVNFESLRKQLLSQNVPLPGAHVKAQDRPETVGAIYEQAKINPGLTKTHA